MADKTEHLERERLSALLDGEEDAEARAHLEACEDCRGELDTLRRMRMALSAMDDLEPPADGWERVAAALPGAAADGERRGGADRARGAFGRDGGWTDGTTWLRVAAALLLFAGGLGVGARLGPEWAGGPAATTAADAGSTPAGSLTAVGPADGDAAYRDALDQLESLRARGPSPEQAYRDPAAAAEHLARLDAVIRATREALQEDPADPAMNEFLFEVVEQREALNEALHLATLEYR